MSTLLALVTLFISYLVGSLPSGWIIVKLTTGKDIRNIESGRTGGTNVLRAAGFWAGLSTAILDLLKGALTVWLVRFIFPENAWLHILAPLAAVFGHNYSIFLLEKNGNGGLRLRGGAGGAPATGGALGLWPPSLLIIVPVAALTLYFGGYASVTTLSIGLIIALIFAYRAWVGASPWVYVLYGLVVAVILIWSLRPNIQRLLQGNERIVGFRARKKKKGEGHSSSSS